MVDVAITESSEDYLPIMGDSEGKTLSSPVAASVVLSSGEILVHVRFRPDGTVWEISACPVSMAKDAWFKTLCSRAGDCFQARAGGRGMFRLTPEQLDAFRSQSH